MPKKSTLPITPRHVFIYNEDWDFLEECYGKDSHKPVGVSAACREIIHQKVLELRNRIKPQSHLKPQE